MFTTILLILVLLLYIGLLLAQRRGKASAKLTAGAQAVQALLWTLIAIDSWAASRPALRIAYLVLILLSLLAAVQSILRGRPRKS